MTLVIWSTWRIEYTRELVSSFHRSLPSNFHHLLSEPTTSGKRTFGLERPAKIQIRLRIRAVWSESSLDAFWIAKDAKFLHAATKTDQTAQGD